MSNNVKVIISNPTSHWTKIKKQNKDGWQILPTGNTGVTGRRRKEEGT